MVVSPAVLSAILGDEGIYGNGEERGGVDSMVVSGGGGVDMGLGGIAPPAGGDVHKHHLRQQVIKLEHSLLAFNCMGANIML